MTRTDEPALACSGLAKRFGSVQALSDVTVTVTAPATGLLGANGAGKSTLMRVALGLLAPDAGTVRVLGLDAATERRAIRQRVGYMPEHPCLPTDLSGLGMCVHVAELRGLSHRDAVRRASEVLFAVGLEEERHRAIATYSLGMAQRAKLAQALVHGPDLVVLDEPTSGLDPSGRAEMLAIIRRLSHELGVQVLVSSHVLEDIERTCDEVVVLHEGRLSAQQPVAAQPRGGPVSVRVTGDRNAFAALLNAAGVPTTPAPKGDVRIESADERVLDLVRDLAAQHGFGLLQLQDEGDRLEDFVVGAMT